MPDDLRDLESLISAWLDERIGEVDSEALQQQLLESHEARALFLNYTRLDASIRQLADVDTLGLHSNGNTIALSPSAKKPPMVSLWAAALAVSAVLLITVSLAVFSSSDPTIATISGLSGPFRWTGDEGRVSTELRVGQKLPGGTIDGLSPESWFELRFEDGTAVTLSGNSMMTFSDDGQKVLHLKSGKLSAKVETQHMNRPMLVHTRSATLTVLGTSFEVDTDLPATVVRVTEGTVRVARTSDGKAVDVPAKHRVIASADRELERQLVPDYVDEWQSRIDRGPDGTFGEWIPARNGKPAMLKSVAFVPEEAPGIVLYLLGMSVQSSAGSPIMLTPRATFQFRGQLNFETDVFFGCSATYENGDFAGKFLAKCSVKRRDSGEFIAIVSPEDFRLDPSVQAYQGKLAASPKDLLINGVWCFTHSKSPSGLRVSEFELGPSVGSENMPQAETK